MTEIEEGLIRRSLTRRGFLGMVTGAAAALVLPKSLEDNIADVRRFWALDRTMAAARQITGGRGYLVVGGRVAIIAQDISGMGRPGWAVEGPQVMNLTTSNALYGGGSLDISEIGDTARITGKVFVYDLSDQQVILAPGILQTL